MFVIPLYITLHYGSSGAWIAIVSSREIETCFQLVNDPT